MTLSRETVTLRCPRHNIRHEHYARKICRLVTKSAHANDDNCCESERQQAGHSRLQSPQAHALHESLLFFS